MSTPSYAEFLEDSRKIENYLVELTGYDTLAEAERVYRFSLEDFATEPTDTPPNELYERRLIGRYQRISTTGAVEAAKRRLSGFIQSEHGSIIRLKQWFGDLDLGTAPCLQGTPIRAISFGGRSAVVRHGGSCAKGAMAFDDYATLDTAIIDGQAIVDLSEVRFKLKGNESRLQSAAQTRRFFGTGRCAIFNGTSTEIDCGTNTAFNFTGAFSLRVHVYVESYPGTESTILGRGSVNADGWGIRFTTGGAIKFATYQSGASQTTLSVAVPLDRWFELEISYNGSTTCTLWIDGDDAVSSAGTHTAPTGNASRHLYIGRNEAGTVRFAGALNELCIRGTSSTEDEFEEWLHRPLDSTEYATFLGYWNFEDGFGSGVATLDNLGSVGSAADGAVTGAYFAASCMGSVDLAGRVMPTTLGEFAGAKAELVDVGTQIYVTHSAATEALSLVRVGAMDAYVDGVTYDGTSGNSWLAFVQGTTADGAIDRCMSPGWTLFRLGNAPARRLTVEGEGDKSDGTYRSTVGSLVRLAATTFGDQPFDDATEVDDSSFDDFESDFVATVGLTFADERPVEQVISQLCETYGAVVWTRRVGGKLAIRQFGDPQTETPVATLDRHAVVPGSLQQVERGAPFGRVIVRYAENPTVLGSGDVYEGADDPAAVAFARTQWRKTTRRSPAVFRRYKDAATSDTSTRFVQRADANVEKARFASLSTKPDQGFIFHCTAQATQLDFGDVVVFHYQDRNEFNELQDRLGTHDDARFYIVGIRDHELGGHLLQLWRPRIV